MARNISTIYQQMLDEKAKYSSLNDLDNTSNVAIWKTVMYVIAVVIAAFEQLQDVFKSELITLAETLPVGTRQWYAQKMLEYQEGYPLTYNRDSGKIEYSAVDESAMIIKVASCVSESDTVVIKVAKDDGNEGLTALTPTQITSVRAYINDFKFAGSIAKLISAPGDTLKLTANIKIDAVKINTLGQSTLDNTKYPVEEAIVNYLKTFSIEDFNSEFLLIKLTDAIQQVDGVKNVNISLAQAKASTFVNYTDILLTEFKTYNTESGYLVVDPTHLLSDNLTYTI